MVVCRPQLHKGTQASCSGRTRSRRRLCLTEVEARVQQTPPRVGRVAPASPPVQPCRTHPNHAERRAWALSQVRNMSAVAADHWSTSAPFSAVSETCSPNWLRRTRAQARLRLSLHGLRRRRGANSQVVVMAPFRGRPVNTERRRVMVRFAGRSHIGLASTPASGPRETHHDRQQPHHRGSLEHRFVR